MEMVMYKLLVLSELVVVMIVYLLCILSVLGDEWGGVVELGEEVEEVLMGVVFRGELVMVVGK